jgi:hypothetical protein
MVTGYRISVCDADALWGIKTTLVSGRHLWIAKLCDAIADVHALKLT